MWVVRLLAQDSKDGEIHLQSFIFRVRKTADRFVEEIEAVAIGEIPKVLDIISNYFPRKHLIEFFDFMSKNNWIKTVITEVEGAPIR